MGTLLPRNIGTCNGRKNSSREGQLYSFTPGTYRASQNMVLKTYASHLKKTPKVFLDIFISDMVQTESIHGLQYHTSICTRGGHAKTYRSKCQKIAWSCFGAVFFLIIQITGIFLVYMLLGSPHRPPSKSCDRISPI